MPNSIEKICSFMHDFGKNSQLVFSELCIRYCDYKRKRNEQAVHYFEKAYQLFEETDMTM